MMKYMEDFASTVERTAAASAIRLAKPSRRAVLQGAGAFTLAAYSAPAQAFVKYPTGGEAMPRGIVYDPLVFVSLETDGTVTITAHRSEMGTGSRTSLPMVIADEMEADWSRVKIVQAPGDEPKYGNQDTDGSRSMRHHLQSMRQIGASIRHMLVEAAAAEWQVDPKDVKVENHVVSAGSKRAGFGELAEAAMKVTVPEFDALDFKDEADFRYIGKGEVEITDLHDITTGKAVYGADVSLPGMKYAAVARPPVVGGKVKSFDDKAARKVRGFVDCVEVKGQNIPAKFAPLGGLAVVADNTWAAIQGRDALQIEWDDGPHGEYESEAYRAEMEKAAKAPGKVLRDQGDWDGAAKSAKKTFARSYHQAHMAHIPMETPVAVARFEDGKLEVWGPMQSPYGAREDLAKHFGMEIGDVTVHTTLLGGGFGRKSKCDYAIEAAIIAKKVGAPVRVQWTREDDVKHSFYHTTSVEHIEVALDDDDKVTGWRHNSVAPSILSTFAPDSGHQFMIEQGMGHVDLPFDIENIRCENGKAMAHTRIGWYRAVSNVPRAFAIQSFVAELADELGKDQLEMLLEMIGPARTLDPAEMKVPEDFWNYGEPKGAYSIDTGRLSNVAKMAAEGAGWGKDLPDGEGIGLAAHRSFVSYVGTAARVKIVDGEIRVPEIHMAVDCGFAANPERIRSQMEGAAVMGMTLALHSGITFEDGRVMQSNFYDYDVVRADNFPEKVVTHIVEHPFSVHASGVGEPGVPPIAPAIMNAVFNATGKRLRSLPTGPSVDI